MAALLLLALLPLDLACPPAQRPAPPPRASLTVELSATIGATRDGTIWSIEVTHRWHGAAPERFLEGTRGVCAGPQDSLLVDGQPRSMDELEVVCDGPVAPVAEEIAPGGGWVTRGHLVLPPGRHVVQAIYRVDEAQARWIGPGRAVAFRGEARSPEVVVGR